MSPQRTSEWARERPFPFEPRPRAAIARLLLLALAIVGVAGCAARTPSPEARSVSARDLAETHGFAPQRIDAGVLTLQAYARGQGPVLTVYIEGDGFAWRSPRRPSSDPTPITPTALLLATRDEAEAVAYLGRPCQYVGRADAACASNDLWTSHRFSEQAIAATDAAIDALKRAAGADRVHLVGYSGGAAVAALTAARRDDVLSLRTVAGYLDPTRLNAERGVSPLTGSLDPIAAAPALRGLPQRHYAGGADRVIPAWSVASFVAAVDDSACAAFVELPDATHADGWLAFWAREGAPPPSC